MPEKSERDKFVIGNLTFDLMERTSDLCSKEVRKTTRFPKPIYAPYTKEILGAAYAAHLNVRLANRSRDKAIRENHQDRAMAYLEHLMCLMDIAFKKGWISEKQNDSFQKLANNVYWKIFNWKKKN